MADESTIRRRAENWRKIHTTLGERARKRLLCGTDLEDLLRMYRANVAQQEFGEDPCDDIYPDFAKRYYVIVHSPGRLGGFIYLLTSSVYSLSAAGQWIEDCHDDGPVDACVYDLDSGTEVEYTREIVFHPTHEQVSPEEEL